MNSVADIQKYRPGETPIEKLRELWQELGDIPVDDDGNTEEDFYHWKAGTDREDIWHWFGERCPNNLVEDLMFSKVKTERYRLPSYWASAIINGDYSGLDDNEEKAVNDFLSSVNGSAIDVDFSTEGFYHCNDAGTLPGECVEYIFTMNED